MKKTYPRDLPSIMTEDKAKTLKICPLSISSEDRINCYGSQCNAWTWERWQNWFGKDPGEPVGRCGLVLGGLSFPTLSTGEICMSLEFDVFDFPEDVKKNRSTSVAGLNQKK
jgi:hypothetical protein